MYTSLIYKNITTPVYTTLKGVSVASFPSLGIPVLGSLSLRQSVCDASAESHYAEQQSIHRGVLQLRGVLQFWRGGQLLSLQLSHLLQLPERQQPRQPSLTQERYSTTTRNEVLHIQLVVLAEVKPGHVTIVQSAVQDVLKNKHSNK